VSPTPGMLEPLRVRIRRFQFILGLGFLALMVGSMVSVSLAYRLSTRIEDLPGELPRLLIGTLLQNLWVLAALPLLAYGAARILELKPLSTALGAALSGEFFVLSLDFVRDGLEGLWDGWVGAVLRLLSFALGVFLSYRAVVSGRAASARTAAAALARAEAQKAEYAEFLREAEKGGERSEAPREPAGEAPPPPPER
jgi:hypothetical protein